MSRWRTLVLVLGLISPFIKASAADWPEGLVLHEESASPDGHYGIIVATSPRVKDGTTFLIAEDGEEFVNYLADLKTHQLLGKIHNGNYVEGENHRHLDTDWSPDSKLCIATYWNRFGFDSIAVLEPKAATFTQANLGERIQKSLDAVLAKQEHDRHSTAEVYPSCKLLAGRKIRVGALGRNNPKSLEDVKTYYALFQGTFDLTSKKWIVTAARPINAEQGEMLQETLDSVYSDYSDKGLTVSPEAFKEAEADTDTTVNQGEVLFRSDEAKAKYLDEGMNEVYKAVRVLLSPARFAKTKQEQIAWLKKRDAADTTAEKCKLIEDRIKVLQQLAQ